MILEVHDVWKTFRLSRTGPTLMAKVHGFLRGRASPVRKDALRGVTLAIERGEKVGLVGTNGSGKTTLMRILAGIYVPTRGETRLGGRVASFLQLGIGTIPRLTVRENVFLYGSIMGLTRREIRSRFERILEFAELEEYASVEVRQLSTGMNQRLTFAVAIQVDADILLMDEILAVGDQHFKNKCYDFFEHRLSGDVTMLFSSHDLKEIRRFCPRTIWLDRGTLVEFGETGAVLRRYQETHGFAPDEA